ncbi:adenosine receptor A3-like [Culicoides brevitarsis]|uniref:adenosine receptor A3-like n=1 Tax=Culicoides brevitarsis TaxID=469753 RepID=UPI00307BA3B9
MSTTQSPLEKFIIGKVSIHNPEFDEMHDSFMALGIIMSIVIVLGNGLVLLLFYQERKSLKISHKYIISMAFCDLFMGLLSVPTQLYMMDNKVPASSKDCPWIMGVITALVQTSLTVLVASSIDRYWAVKFPHHYRIKAQNWIANCIIIVSWIVPCSYGVIHYFTAREATNKDFLCFMGQETYDPIMLRFLLYVIMPINLVIILVLYFLIHREVMKLFKQDDGESRCTRIWKIMFQKQDVQKKVGAMLIREVRTTFLLLLTVFLAFITFIPGTAIGYVMTFRPDLIEVKPLLICYLLLSVNSVFNPFIYAFNIRNVREAATRLGKRIVFCNQVPDENEIYSTSGTGVDSSQGKA